jgi:hypothetical protein
MNLNCLRLYQATGSVILAGHNFKGEHEVETVIAHEFLPAQNRKVRPMMR